jgi:hypothetical protein
VIKEIPLIFKIGNVKNCFSRKWGVFQRHGYRQVVLFPVLESFLVSITQQQDPSRPRAENNFKSNAFFDRVCGYAGAWKLRQNQPVMGDDLRQPSVQDRRFRLSRRIIDLFKGFLDLFQCGGRVEFYGNAFVAGIAFHGCDAIQFTQLVLNGHHAMAAGNVGYG